MQVMALERLQEDKFSELKQHFKSSWQRPSSNGISPVSVKPILNTIPQNSKNPYLPIKRLSPFELKIRRVKSLCYNCDDKYAPGHKCKIKFFYLLGMRKNKILL